MTWRPTWRAETFPKHSKKIPGIAPAAPNGRAMKRLLTLAAVASLCALPAIALAQSSMMSSNEVPVNLKAQNDSGETGTATLVQKGDDVVVTVKMKNAVAPTQPIHIHPGTCANLNPKPQYPLK